MSCLLQTNIKLFLFSELSVSLILSWRFRTIAGFIIPKIKINDGGFHINSNMGRSIVRNVANTSTTPPPRHRRNLRKYFRVAIVWVWLDRWEDKRAWNKKCTSKKETNRTDCETNLTKNNIVNHRGKDSRTLQFLPFQKKKTEHLRARSSVRVSSPSVIFISALTGIFDDRYEYPRHVVDHVRNDGGRRHRCHCLRGCFLRHVRPDAVLVQRLRDASIAVRRHRRCRAAATFPAAQPRPEPHGTGARLGRAASFVAVHQHRRRTRGR